MGPLVVTLLLAAADEPSLDAWLSAAEGYRLRTTGDASDNDASLLVDGGASALSGRVGAGVSGALFVDVDGKSPGFSSVHDAHGPWELLIDTLEVRASNEPWLERFSVGRLTVDEGLPVTLDGAAVRVRPLVVGGAAWSLFGSAGKTVHFYALDDAAREDWTAALGTGLSLVEGLKIEADWRGLVEDSPTGRMQSSYGAAVYRRVDDFFLGSLWARGLDRDLSHVGARAHLVSAPSSTLQIGVDAEGVEQTAKLGEVFEGENPFFAVLGPSEPNMRGSLDTFARADLGVVDAGLHLGAAGRRVLRGEPGPFNRDFGRVYASVEADDVVIKGPFASVIVSYDAAVPRAASDAAGGAAGDAGVDPAVFAVGGSAGYAGDVVKASVGTSWDRTKYSYYRDVNELVDVRTVYASLDVRPLHEIRVKASYTLELADRTVHTVQLTLAQDIDGAW